ncbi:MAG: hypothetical protein K2Q01_11370, partial [Rickettsiales bacterium]|nr:hypothetical protein [Rickettsiales bacterium]
TDLGTLHPHDVAPIRGNVVEAYTRDLAAHVNGGGNLTAASLGTVPTLAPTRLGADLTAEVGKFKAPVTAITAVAPPPLEPAALAASQQKFAASQKQLLASELEGQLGNETRSRKIRGSSRAAETERLTRRGHIDAIIKKHMAVPGAEILPEQMQATVAHLKTLDTQALKDIAAQDVGHALHTDVVTKLKPTAVSHGKLLESELEVALKDTSVVTRDAKAKEIKRLLGPHLGDIQSPAKLRENVRSLSVLPMHQLEGMNPTDTHLEAFAKGTLSPNPVVRTPVTGHDTRKLLQAELAKHVTPTTTAADLRKLQHVERVVEQHITANPHLADPISAERMKALVTDLKAKDIGVLETMTHEHADFKKVVTAPVFERISPHHRTALQGSNPFPPGTSDHKYVKQAKEQVALQLERMGGHGATAHEKLALSKLTPDRLNQIVAEHAQRLGGSGTPATLAQSLTQHVPTTPTTNQPYTLDRARKKALVAAATDPDTKKVDAQKYKALLEHDQQMHVTHKFDTPAAYKDFRDLESKVSRSSHLGMRELGTAEQADRLKYAQTVQKMGMDKANPVYQQVTRARNVSATPIEDMFSGRNAGQKPTGDGGVLHYRPCGTVVHESASNVCTIVEHGAHAPDVLKKIEDGIKSQKDYAERLAQGKTTGQRVARAATATKEAVVSRGGKILSGTLEHGGTLLNATGTGIKKATKGVLIAGAVVGGLAVVTGMLANTRSARRMPDADMGGLGDDPLVFTGNNLQTDMGAISVPQMQQQQQPGSWVSRLPSMDQQMGAVPGVPTR